MSTAQGGVKGEFKKFFAHTPPPLGTDPTKPLILLAQIAICPESRPQPPRLRPPGRNPPPRTAFDTHARPSAPFRTLSRSSPKRKWPTRFLPVGLFFSPSITASSASAEAGWRRRWRHPPEVSDKRFRDGASAEASYCFGISITPLLSVAGFRQSPAS